MHDKFHVIKFLTDAIDETRKREVYEHPVLKRSKYVMLKRMDTMNEKQRAKFELINQSNTLTAKAWKMRENFLELYKCNTEEEAKYFFERWYLSVIHSNIPALKKAAKTSQRYLEGILHQIGNTISNARNAFVPLQLPVPAPTLDIRLELRRGATTINVSWPCAAASQCALWVREVLR